MIIRSFFELIIISIGIAILSAFIFFIIYQTIQKIKIRKLEIQGRELLAMPEEERLAKLQSIKDIKEVENNGDEFTKSRKLFRLRQAEIREREAKFGTTTNQTFEKSGEYRKLPSDASRYSFIDERNSNSDVRNSNTTLDRTERNKPKDGNSSSTQIDF